MFSAVQVALACDREALPPFGTRIISASGLPSIQGDRLPLREYSDEGEHTPDGKTVLQAYLFQKEAQANEWIRLYHEPASYRAKKEEIAQAVTEAIEEAIPALKGRMTLLDVWTPATYHRYFGARAGAFLSNAMTPKAPLRAHSTRIPHLRGCSLATQWLTSPGGLPAAAKAGKLAAGDAIRSLMPRRPLSPLFSHHFPQHAE